MAMQRMVRDDPATTFDPQGERVSGKESPELFTNAIMGVVQCAGDLVKAHLALSGRRLATVAALGSVTSILALVGLVLLVLAVHAAFAYFFAALGMDSGLVRFFAYFATSLVVGLGAFLTARALRLSLRSEDS